MVFLPFISSMEIKLNIPSAPVVVWATSGPFTKSLIISPSLAYPARFIFVSLVAVGTFVSVGGLILTFTASSVSFLFFDSSPNAEPKVGANTNNARITNTTNPIIPNIVRISFFESSSSPIPYCLLLYLLVAIFVKLSPLL
ncbi:MAG: hypothetical protein ACD_25C00076G0002 [uncultured bacterium]|nr:MAG: hypothetical protein ACD_25C00076G0002 [uncultured bacterium]